MAVLSVTLRSEFEQQSIRIQVLIITLLNNWRKTLMIGGAEVEHSQLMLST
jgi:hypothetical protein